MQGSYYSGQWWQEGLCKHIPMPERIARVNALYDAGHTIQIHDSKRMCKWSRLLQLQKTQLDGWGCGHLELSVGEKENYDVWIDDKAFWSENFFRETGEFTNDCWCKWLR